MPYKEGPAGARPMETQLEKAIRTGWVTGIPTTQPVPPGRGRWLGGWKVVRGGETWFAYRFSRTVFAGGESGRVVFFDSKGNRQGGMGGLSRAEVRNLQQDLDRQTPKEVMTK